MGVPERLPPPRNHSSVGEHSWGLKNSEVCRPRVSSHGSADKVRVESENPMNSNRKHDRPCVLAIG